MTRDGWRVRLLIANMLIAGAGGLLTSYTYIMRGGVYANVQTGNLVLLGISIASGQAQWSYLVPVLAFMLGVMLAQLIEMHSHGTGRLRGPRLVLLVEAAVVSLTALMPHALDLFASATISFVCGMQMDAFREYRGKQYATTLLTGNLRSGSEQLWYYVRSRDTKHLLAAGGYGTLILSFFAGVLICSFSTIRLQLHAVHFASAFMIAAMFVMGKSPERMRPDGVIHKRNKR